MTSENRTITYKVGDIIGSDYCLLEKLGEGGMGMVFRAKHMIMESIYALKILRPEQITTATWMRFQAEAKALSKLSHPNVVQIYNMGIDRAGVPFYVMELLSGRSLADEIAAKGPLSLKRAAEIFLPVCSALAFSHKHGIIHRDIKPSNMMLVESHQNTPTVKLVDFGIAKTQHLTGFEGQSLTTTGEIFGTPYYLSPECISGKSADARSDIYSLGCAIFETLTGAPPFQGKSMLHTLMMHQNVSAPTLKSVNPNGVYSQEVEVFVARLLAKDPDDRFQNIDAVAERLNQLCVSDGAQGQGGGNTTTNRQPRAPEEDFSTTTIVTGTNSPWRRNLIIATVLLLTGTAALIALGQYRASQQHKPAKIYKDVSAHPLLDAMKNLESDTAEGIENFSLGKRGQGASARYYYRFPSRKSIGVIFNYFGQEFNAQGNISVPATDRLGFRLNPHTGDTEILKKLSVNEFTDLRLTPQDTSLEQLVTILSGWTRLIHLHIETYYCNSVSDFSRLSRLKPIDDLILSNCDLPPNGLTNLKLLDDVKSLTLERVRAVNSKSRNIDEMLSNISNCRRLSMLKVENVMLTHELIESISKCKSINELILASGNETEVLDDRDLELLSKMPALNMLDVGNAHLSPKSIDLFKHGFKSLKTLKLPMQRWSASDRRKLVELFAKRQFAFTEPRKTTHFGDPFK